MPVELAISLLAILYAQECTPKSVEESLLLDSQRRFKTEDFRKLSLSVAMKCLYIPSFHATNVNSFYKRQSFINLINMYDLIVIVRRCLAPDLVAA